MAEMHTAFIALGSSVGARDAQMHRAIIELKKIGDVMQTSKVYETEPLGASEFWFLNQVVELKTQLDPHALLAMLKTIETKLGRQPRPRWMEREIDLDIIFFDDITLDESDLIIPHVGLAARRFVLTPLADIAPDWRDPRSGCTVRELLNSCLDPLIVTLWNTSSENS